jgi:hypothetical protein
MMRDIAARALLLIGSGPSAPKLVASKGPSEPCARARCHAIVRLIVV